MKFSPSARSQGVQEMTWMAVAAAFCMMEAGWLSRASSWGRLWISRARPLGASARQVSARRALAHDATSSLSTKRSRGGTAPASRAWYLPTHRMHGK